MNMNGNMQDMLRRLQSDPKAMVMHLINSGQVSNTVLQRIMPMIRNMNTTR